MIARICAIFAICAPSLACAEASRYFAVPGSRSPKGTYELVLALKSRAKVDWEHVTWGNQANDTLFGEKQEKVRCLLVRTKDRSTVQVVPNVLFWSAWKSLGAPTTYWPADERQFFIWMPGYWEVEMAEVVRVGSPSHADTADLLSALKPWAKRYVRESHPKIVHLWHSFEVQDAKFLAEDRLSVKLHFYRPRASGNWETAVRLTVKVAKPGATLRASIQGYKELFVIPESPER